MSNSYFPIDISEVVRTTEKTKLYSFKHKTTGKYLSAITEYANKEVGIDIEFKNEFLTFYESDMESVIYILIEHKPEMINELELNSCVSFEVAAYNETIDIQEISNKIGQQMVVDKLK